MNKQQGREHGPKETSDFLQQNRFKGYLIKKKHPVDFENQYGIYRVILKYTSRVLAQSLLHSHAGDTVVCDEDRVP